MSATEVTRSGKQSGRPSQPAILKLNKRRMKISQTLALRATGHRARFAEMRVYRRLQHGCPVVFCCRCWVFKRRCRRVRIPQASRLECLFVASPTRVSVGISSCFHMPFAPSFDAVLTKHPGRQNAISREFSWPGKCKWDRIRGSPFRCSIGRTRI